MASLWSEHESSTPVMVSGEWCFAFQLSKQACSSILITSDKTIPPKQKPALDFQPMMKQWWSVRSTLDHNQKVTQIDVAWISFYHCIHLPKNFLWIIKYDEPPEEKLDHLSASLVINIHLQYTLGLFYKYLSDRRISSFPWFGFFFLKILFSSIIYAYIC